ncbi:uncharacterized protein AC631_05373 [Debaryomyces fabryi]|uniref:Uncharacterized protein n=1 Tax=Debaryomyces fabryi TaxID=58627 RepID=A0A0V1PRJ3_9ASCO|nr:uncharacterized protein AC631_05373 [Debaryomyces fabryi]KRZ98860.1 hypothetical protein AC631_05373 [Debaryomyces fabryi]CUM47340.1 unnamed protein product [Debaryomyces fabryi]
MGRLIEEVRGEGPIRVANEANAVLLTMSPQDYYHGSIGMGINEIEEVKYQQTPRSFCKRDGLANGTRDMVLYVSLFTKGNKVENIAEMDNEGNTDEYMSSDDEHVSEFDDEGYEDTTGISHEDEALFESWSSILSSENNDAPKSVCPLHYIPKKSGSDSDISPVNIPFDGSLKPDTLATDSLLSSLNKDMHITKLQSEKAPVKGLAVSKFTRAFKVLKTSINRTSYSILSHHGYLSPRMTDDAVPGLSCHEREDDSNLEGPQTHMCASGDSMRPPLELPRGNEYRGRDSRMNSLFLRLYAIDYEARCRSILPTSYSSRELSYVINRSRVAKEFHRRFNIISVSNLSRDKLWDNVILPPRIDSSPGAYIDSSSYVYVGNEKKTDTRDRHHYYNKPAGVLYNSRCFYNDQSPQAGNTKLQYTIKGWCNSRWLDCSQD